MTRATWSQKYPESEPRVQGRDMSTYILGGSVFIVGVFVLAIALIIGLEFPKFVKNRALDEQCVTNTQHEFYREWRLEEDWVRYNKLYYWVIENPTDFLYHGQVPVFKERGPYVYREVRERNKVVFQGTRVSFINRITQRYDAIETTKQCGTACSEDDTLSILNTNFLKSTSEVNGLENYMLNQLPGIIRTDLVTLKSVHSIHDIGRFYDFFACLNISCERLFSYNASLESSLRNISFGSWLQMNDTYYKHTIMAHRPEVTILPTEVTAVYENILSSNQLGVNVSHFIDKTLQQNCRKYVAQVICNMTYNDTTNGESKIKQEFPTLADFFTSCGLITILQSNEVLSEPCLSRAANVFLNHICQHIAGSCFKDTVIQPALYLSIRYFILDYLLTYIFNKTSIFSILEIRTQSELALGNSIQCGFLKHDFVNSSSKCGETSYTMSTCLEDRDTSNNMVVKAFSDNVMDERCPTSDSSICRSQRGHTQYLFPVSTPKACVTSTPPAKTYLVWVEYLYRGLEYSGPVQTSFLDTTVFRLKLNTSAYTPRAPEVTCMLWNVSDLHRFPSWISEPHFQGCKVSPHPSFVIASGDDYSSFVEVEPVTGHVWRTVNRFQMNTVLQQHHVTVPSVLSYNVSFTNIAFPIYWLESSSHVTGSFKDRHHDKVTRLTDASCGGLVGLSVLSVLVAFISVFIIIRPHSLRRIAPMPLDIPDESQNNNLSI